MAGLAFHLVADEPLGRHHLARDLDRTPLHQGLRLGQAVGDEQLVLVRKVRLVAPGADHELAGHHLGALVEHLEEGVLAIGAGLAPDHRAGGVGQRLAVHRHALAVRFHLQLLQVGRQPREALVVGQHGAGLDSRRSGGTRRRQAQQQRQVVAPAAAAEMAVHRVRRRAGSARKCFGPDRDRDRQADRPPQRVAPADPVPEAEPRSGIDAEFGGLLEVGRQRREVAPDLVGAEPARRTSRAPWRRWSSSRGREGLGRDDEQRASPDRVLAARRGCACRRRWRRSAGAARRGRASAPASPSPGRGREPPMPMLTTSVKRPPWGVRTRPVRSPSAKSSIRSSVS